MLEYQFLRLQIRFDDAVDNSFSENILRTIVILICGIHSRTGLTFFTNESNINNAQSMNVSCCELWTFQYHRSLMDLKLRLDLLNWNERLIWELDSARNALAVPCMDKYKMIIIIILLLSNEGKFSTRTFKWCQRELNVQSINHCFRLSIINGINTTYATPARAWKQNQTIIIIVSLQNSWLMNDGLFLEYWTPFEISNRRISNRIFDSKSPFLFLFSIND